jgi:hypothetical protein
MRSRRPGRVDRTDLGFAIAVIEAPALAAVDRFLAPDSRLAGYAVCALAALAIYFQADLRRGVVWIVDVQMRQRREVLLSITGIQLVLLAVVTASTWWTPSPIDSILLVALAISFAWQVVRLWAVIR